MRGFLEDGPTVNQPRSQTELSLGPYFLIAAVLPLLFFSRASLASRSRTAAALLQRFGETVLVHVRQRPTRDPEDGGRIRL